MHDAQCLDEDDSHGIILVPSKCDLPCENCQKSTYTSIRTFLDALASLKTMFKIQSVTDVFKILTNTRFKDYYRVLESIAEYYRVLQSVRE